MEGLSGKGKVMRSIEAGSTSGAQGCHQEHSPDCGHKHSGCGDHPATVDRLGSPLNHGRDQCHRLIVEHHAIDRHRLGNVLNFALTQMLDGEIELVLDLVENVTSHTDATRLSQALEPRGHVDPVAVDVVVLDDDVANVDADSIDDPFFFGDIGVTLADQVLDFDRTLDRLDSTGELDQNAIAHQFDDAPLTFSDLIPVSIE